MKYRLTVRNIELQDFPPAETSPEDVIGKLLSLIVIHLEDSRSDILIRRISTEEQEYELEGISNSLNIARYIRDNFELTQEN